MTVTNTTTTTTPEPVHDAPRTDMVVFGVAAALALAFVAYAAVDSEGFTEGAGSVLTWITGNWGWFFVLCSGFFVIFSVFLAMSRYGNIKLGPDDSTPEFSTFSWVSMMFATGMGIGLMFYGVAEPLTHLNAPPMDMAEPGSQEAAHLAMEYTFFHWGFHPWSMYAVIGLAIAYFAYRKGYGNLISAAFRPLLGDKVDGPIGRAIDVMAIFATLFGSATSLGLGAQQITGGLANVFEREGYGTTASAVVIAVLTLAFVLSAVSGIDKGIKWLSNANAVAAGLLVLFVFLVGPTVFILGTFTESIGGYLTHLPAMSFRTGALGGSEWLSGWTIFYWAWWVSWTPFVGMFIARISKGRTIRQFVVFVILVPSFVSFIWFSILGGAAFNLQINEGKDMKALLDAGLETTLFGTLRSFPLATIMVTLAVFLIAIFFVTGADSASIVMGMLSQRGTEEPQRSMVIFWGVATGAVATVLLFANGLSALQTAVIIVGFPFLFVLLGLCFSLFKSLRAESFESTLRGPLRRTVLEHQAGHEPRVPADS